MTNQPISAPFPQALAPAPPTVFSEAATAPECTECAAAIPAVPTLPGEILDCPECGAELEVRSLQPLVLALAPRVEEDWGE